MANKRALKRSINRVCEELFAEGVATSLYGVESHQDNAEALLFSIIKLQSDFTRRVSHPEPGMAPKHYYKLLGEKFSAEVNDIIDQINNL